MNGFEHTARRLRRHASGRMRRTTYGLAMFGLSIAYGILFLSPILMVPVLGRLYAITVALAAFAAMVLLIVRRLHDMGQPAGWALLLITPLAPFMVIWLLFPSGQVGPNLYGPDPRAAR